jgi:hypothetical protein
MLSRDAIYLVNAGPLPNDICGVHEEEVLGDRHSNT